MTNEEIAEKVAKCFEPTDSDTGGMRNAYSEAILESHIAQAMREAVSQAYEESYPLVCNHCADGLPVTHDPGGHYIHIVPMAFPTDGPEEWKPMDVPVGCRAQKLRALKDSLAQESAAST